MIDSQYYKEFSYESEIFNPSFHTEGSKDYTSVNIDENWDARDALATEKEQSYFNLEDRLYEVRMKNAMCLEMDEYKFRELVASFVEAIECLNEYDYEIDVSDITNIDQSLINNILKYGSSHFVMMEVLDIIEGRIDYLPDGIMYLFDKYSNVSYDLLKKLFLKKGFKGVSVAALQYSISKSFQHYKENTEAREYKHKTLNYIYVGTHDKRVTPSDQINIAQMETGDSVFDY